MSEVSYGPCFQDRTRRRVIVRAMTPSSRLATEITRASVYEFIAKRGYLDLTDFLNYASAAHVYAVEVALGIIR